jgi:uncharacterized protein (DUF952 family)
MDGEFLFKVVSPEQWEKSIVKKEVHLSDMDKDFIHLATEEQLANVIKKFWPGMDHVILRLYPKKLKGRLIFETNPGGTTQYFHLYSGSIPLEAVIEAKSIKAKW